MADLLTEFSQVLIARATAARGHVVAIQLSRGRHITGTVWSADTVIASEQALPDAQTFAVVMSGGVITEATLAGRDRGPNVAVLRLRQPAPAPSRTPGDVVTGALVFVHGADGAGNSRFRTGVVNMVGPEWVSSAGGRIDRRIVLDVWLSPAEEGGPVHDVSGACVGVSCFGPHRQVLVIPIATIDRVTPALLDQGRVARGWLGVAVQPVAIPDALQAQAGQASGLMVMSLADGGPAATAGVHAGDIVLGMNSVSTARFRSLARELGPESIGRKVELRVIRGDTFVSMHTTIEASPA